MKQNYTIKFMLLLCLGLGVSNSWSQDVTTFTYTGATDTYVVPGGVTQIQIEVWGGQGQEETIEDVEQSLGGLGGYAIGLLDVTPGEILTINVGGAGTDGAGGFNGGGLGGFGTPSTHSGGYAGSGGGASDVRQGGAALGDRVIVGGGGGGGGRDYMNGTCIPCGEGGNGGDGGALTGLDGDDVSWSGILGSFPNVGSGGKGGTPVAGGAAGDGPNGPPGLPGALGIGGNGVNGTQSVATGGGGGGYYGGGSGGGANSGNGVAGGGGAGGSSYIGGVIDGVTTPGIREGNGEIIITVLCNAMSLTVSDDEICLGDEITLDAESESGAEVSWDMGVIDEVPFTPGEAGTITYTATTDDLDDCVLTVDIIVNELPFVYAGAGDDNFCEDEEVVLAAGGGADVYTWDPLDLEPGVGVHTYVLTGEDSETGCINTDEITVEVHALPTVSASVDNETICVGNDIELTGGGAESYEWAPGDIEDGESFDPGAVGSYTYEVIGTDENGCIGTASVDVTVVEGITLTYTTMDEILGDDGEINLTVTGGVPTYTYDWNTDESGDFDDDEDLTGLSDGIYTVKVRGATGCFAETVVILGSQLSIEESLLNHVTIYPNPTVSDVTISLEGEFAYEITAVNGEVLASGIAVDQEMISLQQFAAGTYFVNVSANGETGAVRVVKQ